MNFLFSPLDRWKKWGSWCLIPVPKVSQQGGDGGSQDWHPGVCLQTLPIQDGKSGSQLSPPNRPANRHEPLIEDWKIIMCPVLLRSLNQEEINARGGRKCLLSNWKRNPKTYTGIHMYTHTQLNNLFQKFLRVCFFFSNSLFLLTWLPLTQTIYTLRNSDGRIRVPCFFCVCTLCFSLLQ